MQYSMGMFTFSLPDREYLFGQIWLKKILNDQFMLKFGT